MKFCGERLGLCYAQATGSVYIAVRIGCLNPIGKNRPEDLPIEAPTRFKHMRLSNRDLCQLMELAITVAMPPRCFHIVNGMSDNEGMAWDIEYAREVLGYIPQDGLTLDCKLRTKEAISTTKLSQS